MAHMDSQDLDPDRIFSETQNAASDFNFENPCTEIPTFPLDEILEVRSVNEDRWSKETTHAHFKIFHQREQELNKEQISLDQNVLFNECEVSLVNHAASIPDDSLDSWRPGIEGRNFDLVEAVHEDTQIQGLESKELGKEQETQAKDEGKRSEMIKAAAWRKIKVKLLIYSTQKQMPLLKKGGKRSNAETRKPKTLVKSIMTAIFNLFSGMKSELNNLREKFKDATRIEISEKECEQIFERAPENGSKKSQPNTSTESSSKRAKKTSGKTSRTSKQKVYKNGDYIYNSIRDITPADKLELFMKKTQVIFIMYCVCIRYSESDIINQTIQQVKNRRNCKVKSYKEYKEGLEFIVGNLPRPHCFMIAESLVNCANAQAANAQEPCSSQ